MPTQTKDFSIEKKLRAIIKLQKIDSKMDEILVLKGELPEEVRQLEDEYEGLKTRLNNIDSGIESINEYIDKQKKAQKESVKLIDRYEEQQDHVKNNREYEAVTKEIELEELELKAAQNHEKEAAARLQQSEHSKMLAEAKLDTKKEALEAKRKELQKIIKETEAEEKELKEKEEKAKKKVDSRLLKSYEKIRKNFKNGLAVAPVIRESCGGCFNVIPPQRQYEIHQHKKIIACEHCGRILIDKEFNDKVRVR